MKNLPETHQHRPVVHSYVYQGVISFLLFMFRGILGQYNVAKGLGRVELSSL